MMFIVIEWSAYTVLMVLLGLVDTKSQATHSILTTITMVILAIPLGIQTTACTMVGNKVGEGDTAGAKHTFKHINIFALAIFVITMAFMALRFNWIWSFFNQDIDMNRIFDEVLPFFMLYFIGDFT